MASKTEDVETGTSVEDDASGGATDHLPMPGDTGSRMSVEGTTTDEEDGKEQRRLHHLHIEEDPPEARLTDESEIGASTESETKPSKIKKFGRMFKKKARAVGEFLGFNETEDHMQLWKDRMTEMAKTDHIGIHMEDVNMRKQHCQADVVFTLKKALEEVADDPEEEKHILESDDTGAAVAGVKPDELKYAMHRTQEKALQRRMTRQFSRAMMHDMNINMECSTDDMVEGTPSTPQHKVSDSHHLPGVEPHHTHLQMMACPLKANNLLDELRHHQHAHPEQIKDMETRKAKGDEVEIAELHKLSVGAKDLSSVTNMYGKGRTSKVHHKDMDQGQQSIQQRNPCSRYFARWFPSCAKPQSSTHDIEQSSPEQSVKETPHLMEEHRTSTEMSLATASVAYASGLQLRAPSFYENVGSESIAVMSAPPGHEKDMENSTEGTTLTAEELEKQLQIEELAKQGLKPLPEGADPKDYAYRKEALDHYREFVEMEEDDKKEIFEERKKQMIQKLHDKQEVIAQALEIGKEFYCQGKVSRTVQARHAHESHSKESVASHHHHIRHIRKQLEDLNVFRPWFIGIITVLQFIVLIVAIAVGGVTTIALEPILRLKQDITFIGTLTVHHWFIPNLWIGPTMEKLIGMGAVYGLCMRKDMIMVEMDTLYRDVKLGCCEVPYRNVAGTTTHDDCKKLTSAAGKWYGDYKCSERDDDQNLVSHNLKPCCYVTESLCRLTAKSHCEFVAGIWHKDADHCSEVNCVKGICNLGYSAASDHFNTFFKDEGYIMNNQWFRFPFSLLLHYGAIHYVIVAGIQVLVGAQIEKLAGWLRVGLIYIISGLMALVTAGLFDDKHPQCGAMGAVFGLLGVQSVELIQSWKIIAKPWREMSKLLGIIALLLLAGTFSFINNIGNVMGYAFGIITGILFLPFITFGQWDSRRKRILILITWPFALIGVFILHYCFYEVQHLSCMACHYFSCIPYTEHTCESYTNTFLHDD